MNKTKFLELVKNPELIEENDLTKLDQLISEHPYSQIIHVLSVKGRKILEKPDFEKSLNLAATYTYDRSLLRTLIEGENIGSDSPDVTLDSASVGESGDSSTGEEAPDFSWINEDDEDDIFVDDPAEVESTLPAPEQDAEEVTQTEDSVEELESDQEVVEEQEHEQELVEEDQPEEEHEIETESPLASQEPEEPTLEDNEPETTATSVPQDKTEQDSGAEDPVQKPIIETNDTLGDSLDLEIQAEGIHAELMKNLNQLQENKQQYEQQPDENGDLKGRQDQIEIIDNFIKNSPVLSKPNLSADSEGLSQDDLSKQSTQLSDELASENLAKIYLKQGKRKDAEKIYKKLITKFPQKKAYFADQIQKIKKK